MFCVHCTTGSLDIVLLVNVYLCPCGILLPKATSSEIGYFFVITGEENLPAKQCMNIIQMLPTLVMQIGQVK